MGCKMCRLQEELSRNGLTKVLRDNGLCARLERIATNGGENCTVGGESVHEGV